MIEDTHEWKYFLWTQVWKYQGYIMIISCFYFLSVFAEFCFKTYTMWKNVEKCKVMKNLEFKSLFLFKQFCVQYILFFLISDFTMGWIYVVYCLYELIVGVGLIVHIYMWIIILIVCKHCNNTQCLYVSTSTCNAADCQWVFCLKLLYIY